MLLSMKQKANGSLTESQKLIADNIEVTKAKIKAKSGAMLHDFLQGIKSAGGNIPNLTALGKKLMSLFVSRKNAGCTGGLR